MIWIGIFFFKKYERFSLDFYGWRWIGPLKKIEIQKINKHPIIIRGENLKFLVPHPSSYMKSTAFAWMKRRWIENNNVTWNLNNNVSVKYWFDLCKSLIEIASYLSFLMSRRFTIFSDSKFIQWIRKRNTFVWFYSEK